MGIKAFHIFFISVALLFAGGVGILGLVEYRDSQAGQDLAISASGGGLFILLLVYGAWFLQKLKKLNRQEAA
jgi:hypothetical protein